MEERQKAKLSKGLLDMKFMKKTKDSLEKEADDAVGTALYSHEVTDSMKKKGELIFMDASMSSCKNLMEGRLSFGGMNPDIERYMQTEYNKKMEEIEKAKEKDVSDADMAKQTALSSNIGKKFQSKNQRKFLKPESME